MTALFDIRILNLNAGSELCMAPEKALSKLEAEKKDKYFQPCVYYRRHFTPLFYYIDGIPGVEGKSAQRRTASTLRYNMKQ